MVLLAGSTGLRRGELIGLRWGDIDFQSGQANVTRSVWRNVEGDTKTEASRKPVPLHSVVMDELGQWHKESLYSSDSDFVFPSVEEERQSSDLAGDDSETPDPAGAEEVGHHQARGVPYVSAYARDYASSEPHRHQDGAGTAAPRESQNDNGIYQQAVSAEIRVAQNRVVAGHPSGWGASAPFSTLGDHMKDLIVAVNRWFYSGLWRGRRGSNPRPLP